MNGDDQDEAGQLSGQLARAEQLPANLVLLRMENEQMMAVARTKPRDQAMIVKQLGELIDSFPAAADDSIYRKPVGSVSEGSCVKCGIRYELPYKGDFECPGCGCSEVKDREKTMKFAEGLSIRAAESIRAIYGCNRLAVSTEQLADGAVRIAATFVDYAGLNMTSDDAIVSPWYKSKGGGMQRTPEDRFLGVVVKAAKSKLVRDVILDAVPNNIKAAFREMCERKLAGLVSPEVVDQQIIPHFLKLGLSVEHLEKLLGGRPKALGWTEEDRIRLKQIATAIKNNETTVAAILADLREDEPKNGSKPSGGAVSGSDLAGKKKEPEASKEKLPAQGQGSTAPDQAKEAISKPATPAPAATDTTAAQSAKSAPDATPEAQAAQSGAPGIDEQEEIRREEFAEAVKEKYAAEHGTIFSTATANALGRLRTSLDKMDELTPAEKQVMHGWIAARGEQLKGKGGQKSLGID